MHDFFSYSGFHVQYEHESSDMSAPIAPAGIRGGTDTMIDYTAMAPQPCNMFAIAKVGLPNIIFPNTLDVKFSNFEDFDSYINISDLFFPNKAKSQ